ncbi:MAG: LicD family protein [Muribaculaceae bacterium]|nr:LicD family protein [Muribaculaceae bacterium]
MTECERIIAEGILPESFFKEEIICDFLVTEKRKKIWAVSLDILIQFDRICRKHNLKYFMAVGSLLGIVRHNGFIPWDDDVDICMPRDDYERFIAIAQSELPPPYFLQIPGRDNDYFFSFTRLRNSNSTSISPAFRYCKFNQGIFIDIFILDNCHLTDVEKNYHRAKELILENSAYMRSRNPHPTPYDIEKLRHYKGRDPHKVLAELNTIYAEMNKKRSDLCMITGIAVYKPNRMIYKWNDVLDLVDVDFYGHQILIPRNAEQILTTTYGDFMQFPPIEERGNWHDFEAFDPDKPYDKFLRELLEKEA